MKIQLVAGLICGSCLSSCVGQITTDLRQRSMSACRPGWTIGTADHSYAPTDKDIFDVNQKLANHGNTEAAFLLGQAYIEGIGVGRDTKQAIHWFEIGATTPDEKAFVAHLFTFYGCFEKDLNAAARWYTAAGRPADFFALAEAYRMASPPEIDKAAPIYVGLLKETGQPEVRRAQLELGNLILDGKYSASNDADGRALNLIWARTIAQELLGGEEYKIALDYKLGLEGITVDKGMWLQFCKRAAVYNIDLAQQFYAEAISKNEAPNESGYDEIVWTRLGSDKRFVLRGTLISMESKLNAQERQAADSAYDALVKTRELDGAYYLSSDPLRAPSLTELVKMPQDDPDVQLRYAIALEATAKTDEKAYRQALALYRTVRDRREMDIRFVLGRNYLNGANGMPKDLVRARQWLRVAASRGSKPAAEMLDSSAKN